MGFMIAFGIFDLSLNEIPDFDSYFYVTGVDNVYQYSNEPIPDELTANNNLYVTQDGLNLSRKLQLHKCT